jgi:hypothetical protein
VLRRLSRELGRRALDGRTTFAKTMADLRAQLVLDLGGAEEITRAKSIILDDVVRLTFWIDAIDGWLMQRDSVVNGQKRSLYPIVLQRGQLVEQRLRLLQALGLERKQKPIPTLGKYMADYEAARTVEVRAAHHSHVQPRDAQAGHFVKATPASETIELSPADQPPAPRTEALEPQVATEQAEPAPKTGGGEHGEG